MAKKKEDSLQYLQMPLPKGTSSYKMSKISWSGLNYRQTIDSGELSSEKNISTVEAPYLTPSPKPIKYKNTQYSNPIGLFGFDDFLIVLYGKTVSNTRYVYLDYIDKDGNAYTGRVSQSSDWTTQRSLVQFNHYDIPTDPLNGTFIKKLLIFPDRVSMPMIIERTNGEPESVRSDCMFYNTLDQYYYRYIYHEPVEIDDLSDRTDTTKVYQYTSGGVTVFYQYIGGAWVAKQSAWAWTKMGIVQGEFPLDQLAVTVKTYFNNVEDADVPGLYPPPASADTNYYYKNTYNNDVYKYVEIEGTDGSISYGWRVAIPPSVPPIKYATVHQSRLFGADDTRVYASAFNDYGNWNLDTVGEYNESGAWCSPSQANVKAGGDFTGITTFDGHVVCFKRDFMHEIYNNKNPFRIADIYAEGVIDQRTIQDVDGALFFVSDDHVKVYTGGNPRIMDYNLGMSGYTYAVGGTDGRNYYLYAKDSYNHGSFYVYDTLVGAWSEREMSKTVQAFAHNKNGMYMLSNGYIYQMDTDDFDHDWSFETDLLTRQSNSGTTVNIKHLKKIQMLADIGIGSEIQVYILYDDETFNAGTSHLVYDSTAHSASGQTPIRVKPRNTAHYGMKLHVEGYGFVRLYALELLFEPGGETFV